MYKRLVLFVVALHILAVAVLYSTRYGLSEAELKEDTSFVKWKVKDKFSYNPEPDATVTFEEYAVNFGLGTRFNVIYKEENKSQVKFSSNKCCGAWEAGEEFGKCIDPEEDTDDNDPAMSEAAKDGTKKCQRAVDSNSITTWVILTMAFLWFIAALYVLYYYKDFIDNPENDRQRKAIPILAVAALVIFIPVLVDFIYINAYQKAIFDDFDKLYLEQLKADGEMKYGPQYTVTLVALILSAIAVVVMAVLATVHIRNAGHHMERLQSMLL